MIEQAFRNINDEFGNAGGLPKRVIAFYMPNSRTARVDKSLKALRSDWQQRS